MNQFGYERPRDWLDVSTTPRRLRLDVVKAVAEQHGVSLADVMSETRRQPIAYARQAAMVALKRGFNDSAGKIGRLLNRDRTTVLHALRKAGVA